MAIADVSIFLLVRNTKSYLCQSFVVHYKALGEERQVYTEVRFQGIPHGSTDAPQKLHLYSEWEFLNWKFDYSMMGDQQQSFSILGLVPVTIIIFQ